MSKYYNIDDLLYLMKRLRDPETGCPWDLKQDFNTLVKYTIEETYEVIDAISNKDHDNLCEELGDLLLQVVFYAQIAKDESLFSWNEIVHQLVEKMIRRHPHVFPDGDLQGVIPKSEKPDEQKIKQSWESIKQKEKQNKASDQSEKSILDGIPSNLPALHQALKIQKKAASVGFDWVEASQVLDKLKEETKEIEEAMESGEREHIKEELGDLFFTLVNLSRHLHLDPEVTLRESSLKFRSRFQKLEQNIVTDGSKASELSSEALERKWHDLK